MKFLKEKEISLYNLYNLRGMNPPAREGIQSYIFSP